MRRGHRIDVEVVFNLARQQISMLEADLLRSAFQMHKGPAALIELVGAHKAGISRRQWRRAVFDAG